MTIKGVERARISCRKMLKPEKTHQTGTHNAVNFTVRDNVIIVIEKAYYVADENKRSFF